MDPLLISAASGMNARMEALDVLANNIANTGTAGYKADREFNTLFQSHLPFVQRQWTDYSQGNLTPTGNPLNLGLDGPGFFALNTPTTVIYTRNGAFQISKTSNQLQTAEGYTLRNTRDQGKPIVVDPAQSIDIDKDGVVHHGAELGKIEIVTIDDAQTSLKKQGASYYALDAGAETPKPVTATQVLAGTLEQSNVPASEQAVRLVSIMRQFEMLQRAMVVGTNMDKQAIQEVAKVT